MTLEEKLEIVSKNYADKYIEDVNVKSMVHKAYCEGFKAGYKKATTQCQPQIRSDGMIQIDMSMPRTCSDCPFLQGESFELYCPIALNSTSYNYAKKERMRNCPLQEIKTEVVSFIPNS